MLPSTMLKFMVVCHRRPDWTREEFRRYFKTVHEPLALALPGLRRYVQSFATPDERRDPQWDAVIELWFDDRAAMEAAWRSEAGARAGADNARCMDLGRSSWSVVEELVVRAGG